MFRVSPDLKDKVDNIFPTKNFLTNVFSVCLPPGHYGIEWAVSQSELFMVCTIQYKYKNAKIDHKLVAAKCEKGTNQIHAICHE